MSGSRRPGVWAALEFSYLPQEHAWLVLWVGITRNWLESLWSQRQALTGKVKLIAWDAKDIAFREKELQTWIKAFPDTRVLRFPHSGHFIPEENPDELAQAILALDGKNCNGIRLCSKTN